MPLISVTEEHILAQIGTYELCMQAVLKTLSEASGGLDKLTCEDIMMWLHSQWVDQHLELLHLRLRHAFTSGMATIANPDYLP